MVTDRLFRRLRKLIQTEGTLANAADKAGIDEKTARKYRDSDALPSRMAAPHTWRTRLAFFTRRVRKHSLLGPFGINRFIPRQFK